MIEKKLITKTKSYKCKEEEKIVKELNVKKKNPAYQRG